MDSNNRILSQNHCMTENFHKALIWLAQLMSLDYATQLNYIFEHKDNKRIHLYPHIR